MKRINLLPHEERAKASRERGLIYAILALVCLVVALAAVWWYYNNQVGSKQTQVAAQEDQIAATQAQIDALTPYQTLQTQRTDMSTVAKGIYQARVPWSTILEELSLVIPDDVRLVSLTGNVPATMVPGGAVGAAATAPVAPGAQEIDVTFTGEAATHYEVAKFMTRLGLMPQLYNVRLQTSTVSPTVGVTFTVVAALRPYVSPPPPTTLTAAVVK